MVSDALGWPGESWTAGYLKFGKVNCGEGGLDAARRWSSLGKSEDKGVCAWDLI